jgi:cyclin-dependent kinase 2
MMFVPLQLGVLRGTTKATTRADIAGDVKPETLFLGPSPKKFDDERLSEETETEIGTRFEIPVAPGGSPTRVSDGKQELPDAGTTVVVTRHQPALAVPASTTIPSDLLRNNDNAKKRTIDTLHHEVPGGKRVRAEGAAPGSDDEDDDAVASDDDDGEIDVFTPKEFSERFTKILTLGEGTYGAVYSVKDNQQKCMLAMKRSKPCDEEGIPSSVIREFLALKRCQHENVVELVKASFVERAQSRTHPAELVLFFDVADMDLRERLNGFAADHSLPSKKQVRSWMHQLLSGLNHMHQLGIAHRDLKPQNILLRGNHLKIADLGMARSCEEPNGRYSHAVVTQWYRSPELLLGAALCLDPNDVASSHGYDPFAVDMWSVGCILAEMTELLPMFAGRNEAEQFRLIMRVCGVPEDASWPGVSSLINYGWAHAFLRTPGVVFHASSDINVTYSKLRHIAPHLCSNGRELLLSLLAMNPTDRLRADQALHDPYFDSDGVAPKGVENFLYRAACPVGETSIAGKENTTLSVAARIPELAPGSRAGKLLRRDEPERDEAPVPFRPRGIYIAVDNIQRGAGFELLSGRLGREFNPTMRMMVMDWLIGVADRHKVANATLHLAAAWFDQFICECADGPYMIREGRGLPKNQIQIAAAACLWMAIKANEVVQLSAAQLIYYTAKAYTVAELCQMESHVLLVIGDSPAPTSVTAHQHLQDLLDHDTAHSEAFELARCILDCSLLDPAHNTRSPRTIAAGCVALAQEILKTMTGICDEESKSASMKNVLYRLQNTARDEKDSRAALYEVIGYLEDACAVALSDPRVDFLHERWGGFNCRALAQHVAVECSTC